MVGVMCCVVVWGGVLSGVVVGVMWVVVVWGGVMWCDRTRYAVKQSTLCILLQGDNKDKNYGIIYKNGIITITITIMHMLTFRRFRKTAKTICVPSSYVCLNVCMENLGFYFMDFHDILYLCSFRNSVE